VNLRESFHKPHAILVTPGRGAGAQGCWDLAGFVILQPALGEEVAIFGSSSFLSALFCSFTGILLLLLLKQCEA